MTQRVAAVTVGMHRNYFGALELGYVRAPTIETYCKLANGFNVTAGLFAAVWNLELTPEDALDKAEGRP